jgi:hypothetical protein
MNPTSRFALLLTLLACAPLASAARLEKVYIEAVIPYASEDVGSPALRSECNWNAKLPRRIVNASNGRIAIAKGPLDQQAGATLTIRITEAHIRGGGVYTGDKSARIEGELRRNGEVVKTFDLRRTEAGSVNACGAANAVGSLLARDVGAWIQAIPPAPAVDAK